MSAWPQTQRLLVAIGVVGVLDAGVWWVSLPDRGAEPPHLAPFEASKADTLRIGRLDTPLVLSRGTEGWTLAPNAMPADPAEVEAILSELADGVQGELSLEESPENLDKYGLSGGAELRVDVEGSGAVLSSLYIGHDAGGGTTWIRLPDDDRVSVARIGGRARYDRKPSTLRDRRLLELDPATVTHLELHSGSEVLRATHEGADWKGDPYPVDVPTIDELIRALSTLRALEMTDQDEGIDWTLARVILGTGQGSIELQFGQAETFRYAKRIGREGVGRINVPWIDRLADPHSFADRALWTVDRIDAIALRAPGRDGLLERDGENWVMRRPAHVDIDPNQLSAVVSFLSRPRVLAWDTNTPPVGTEHVWTVTTSNGVQTLELGAIDGEKIAVRANGRTGWLDQRVVRAVEGLFGG